ncbi:hypothetical protein AVEN_194059-1 [Araneus ventricosus]|uniref:Uncharacterized protein n=1 Tax=Araneus ventricosus TaxID=182803 RepID=A0A4Y2DHZ5_ARAVE|nr:hypothetical protein AVEN_194059-1 [Araneus ventricosus]
MFRCEVGNHLHHNDCHHSKPSLVLGISTFRFPQHGAYFRTDLVILNHGQMTRTTPELAHPSPNFHATLTGGHLATTYDLACSRPHKRRIFGGIGFQAWSPPAPRPIPYH